MPADPRWQDQDGRAWDGQQPRHGGYDMPGAGRAGGPWPDDGRFGYEPGGPPPGYGFQGRDGYAAGYPERFGGYAAARPAPSDQQQPRYPRDAAAGDSRAERPEEVRPVARLASQGRKTGPPAALPPGPSASSARASGQDTDAARAAGQEADATRASQAEQGGERSQPSVVTAAAPPSPTGTPPPAVTEVASSGPPAPESHAGHDGDEIVSPDAETTPMAVILGDQPLNTQEPAEHAATGGAPRRAASFQQPGSADERREAEQAGPPGSAPAHPWRRTRGPFEPPAKPDPVEGATRRSASAPAPVAAGSSAGSAAGSAAGATTSEVAVASVWSPATAKMDQIKDLYLTAEAIGEEALDKHFELVSDRQRQLIREYFDRAVSGGSENGDAAS